MPSSAQVGGPVRTVLCPQVVYTSCSTERVRHGDRRLTTGGVCMTRIAHPASCLAHRALARARTCAAARRRDAPAA
eukprot:2380827-Lingulodinium_polyedra.AAC.1